MSRPVPAEWAPHRAMWLGFPSHEDLWEDNLAPAQDEVEALARALAGPGGERVRLMTGSDAGEAEARGRLDGVTGIEIVPGRFGDVWLRDTGPIFLGPEACVGFRFNGWGGKYDLPHDDEVAAQVAGAAGATLLQSEAVLEGGALDHDGEGTVLTTRQCLLNPNRNAGWTEAVAEAALARDLGEATSGLDVVIAHNVCSLNVNIPLTAALRRLVEDRAIRRLVTWNHDVAAASDRYRGRLHPGRPWGLFRLGRPVLRSNLCCPDGPELLVLRLRPVLRLHPVLLQRPVRQSGQYRL